MSNSIKVVIAVVLIIGIGIAFWQIDWKKKMDRITELKKTIDEQNKILSDKTQMLQEIPKLKTEKEQLEQELQAKLSEKVGDEDLKNFVPNYMAQIDSMVTDVRSATGDMSFDLLSLTWGEAVQEQQTAGQPQAPSGTPDASKEPAKPQEDKNAPTDALSRFSKRTFTMNMKGKYSTLLYFFDQVGALKLRRLVTIGDLSLTPESGEPGTSPVLSITIPITAYLKQGGAGQ